MNLAAVLRAEGVNVREEGNWQHHVRPGDWHPAGVMWHHTAGLNALRIVRDGRSDLPGPLSNIYLAKTGVAHLVGGGRSNHAGRGSGVVLAGVRRDFPPAGDARDRQLVDDVSGNPWFYGIEMENLGDGRDPWPPIQIEMAIRIGAALCRAHGWAAARNIAHREWTARKPDPRGIDIGLFRSRIANRLIPSPTSPLEEDDMPIFFRKEGNPAVYVMTPRGPKPVPSPQALDQLKAGGVAVLPAATFDEWIR